MTLSVSSVQRATGAAVDKQPSITKSDQVTEETTRPLVQQQQGIQLEEGHRVKSIERALEAVKGKQVSLEMSIHEATNEVLIKVLDKETGELIREVPSEKILDMVSKFMEMNGMLFDERI